MSESLHDECGVVGIFLNNEGEVIPPLTCDGISSHGRRQGGNFSMNSPSGTPPKTPESSFKAASLSYFALYSLQHRGQESAGIAVSRQNKISVKKDMGLVSEVFTEQNLSSLCGNIAISHVRYATAGGKTIENAQPMVNHFLYGELALAHNGQLTNYAELQKELAFNGSTFSSTSDTEVILKLLAKNWKDGLNEALKNTVLKLKGSFALVIMTGGTLIGIRDPAGIRPLVLGKIKEEGWILASETCAIDAVNGTFVRDIAPGEIVIINKNGLESIPYPANVQKRTCIFEYVYFARPDSIIDGIPVQKARERMGAILAKEDNTKADVAIGVPDSGIGAALGYAKEKGIPYAMGIVKNKYIGRTFIAPSQKERENMVFVKLNAIRSDIEGKKVVVIDDSIVRGTTSRRLVQILRRAGAKEVHFRVSSPPVKFPCHLGIDTPTKAELISSEHEAEEICKEIGADSLAFISLTGMIQALTECNAESSGFCEGCFNGRYPA